MSSPERYVHVHSILMLLYNMTLYTSDRLFDVCVLCTELVEAEGLDRELEWMSEMTEDEYNELTPRTRLEIDRVRLHINKQRLKKYTSVLFS